MANNFVYSQPVKIYFGEGKFASLPEILTELGVQRCVIACGKHFAPQAEKLREEIEAVKAVFGGVEQNPQLSGIIETVKLCRETNADAVIGIGGGSSLDTATRPRPAPAARSPRSPSSPTARRKRRSTTRSSCRGPRSSIRCCPPPCLRARR